MIKASIGSFSNDDGDGNENVKKVSYLLQSCTRSYINNISDGEIWRPLPDEGYRPDILWAGMRWEERKTNHPKEGP